MIAREVLYCYLAREDLKPSRPFRAFYFEWFHEHWMLGLSLSDYRARYVHEAPDDAGNEPRTLPDARGLSATTSHRGIEVFVILEYRSDCDDYRVRVWVDKVAPLVVLLDGCPARASQIDPRLHRYVGMWRPPEAPIKKYRRRNRDEDLSTLHENKQITEEWRAGHCDVPQYETIVKKRQFCQYVEDRPGQGHLASVPTGAQIGVPLEIAKNAKCDSSIRNGDVFEFGGRTCVALRDELINPA